MDFWLSNCAVIMLISAEDFKIVGFVQERRDPILVTVCIYCTLRVNTCSKFTYIA